MEIIIGIIVLVILGAIFDDSEPFTYRQKKGSWRAYFKESPPSYEHLYHDNDGYYVCWDRPLRSKADAQKVAKMWMERYK